MAAPSYTYSLTNGSTADASQVMQNYNDILNGVTDGTKDITVNALTANGTANLKGQVNLGDAAADDIQFNGSLATTVLIKTNTSFDVGDTTHGLRALYLGGTSTFTAKLLSATLAASRVYTLGDAGAAANVVLNVGTTGDSNLGTISSATIDKYYEGSFSLTFDQNAGSGGSSNVKTVNYVRTGKQVTLQFPDILITTGGSASSAIGAASSSIPSALRPTTAASSTLVLIVNGAATQTTPGYLRIATNGAVTIQHDLTAASNFSTATGSCGCSAVSISYTIQ